MQLNLALDTTLCQQGILHYHTIDFDRTSHIMTIGASGSGKTFLNKLVIGRISHYISDSQVTVLDFKADDYNFLRGTPRLYEFKAVKDGLDAFYGEFLARQQGKDPDRSFRLLVVEEYGSLLSFYDKKDSENIRSTIANLIFLGRAFNVHCLISTQRPDSGLFNSGVRDSISVIIALGNLSKEGKSMLFPGFGDEMPPVAGQGSGYMLTNGVDLRAITVPAVGDVDKLHHYIREAVSR